MYLVRRLPTDRSDAGFTVLEVLVALAILAVSVVAIGSVMSTSAHSVRVMENHVALVETAQEVLTTALPPRDQLAPGRLSGRLRDFGWQVDIAPIGGNWEVGNADVAWLPELVKIRVRSPGGASIDLETVRLMRRPQQ